MSLPTVVMLWDFTGCYEISLELSLLKKYGKRRKIEVFPQKFGESGAVAVNVYDQYLQCTATDNYSTLLLSSYVLPLFLQKAGLLILSTFDLFTIQ